ncbi:fungal-specific transcription factor domain-containing protein [Cokeromyces recurvatus]|uniref:fungal-specific transcription factor domain-containing protein n=1 Tax=Cokeromyces recurvatus TaxID=90255 RepID=UPI00221EB6CD|nr:fungal-specific transcription factor domain-containing protein [Cokeromyces recurvatus]KAI7903392.1 fungal-specific transcription factor domain-containing protein [Cokeromyces recurvatus]
MNANDEQVNLALHQDNYSLSAKTKRSRITRAYNTHQCNTCKQYGWECTFNDVTKKRGPPKGYIESLENRLRKMEELIEKIQPETNPATKQVIQDKVIKLPLKQKILTMPPKSDEYNSKVATYLGSSSGYYLVKNILSSTNENEEPLPLNRRDSTYVIDDGVIGPVKFRKINVVDDDIMFVRDKTLDERVNQLESDKLNLDPNIAPQPLVKELIMKYFQMDHAILPIVDEEPFMNAFEGRIQPPPPSILIYAICIHTCISLSIDDPIFKFFNVDRNELFQTLVDHITSLVKKEYFIPRRTTIQALILLCTIPACDKLLCKHWIRSGMAVRMAQGLGFHRTVEKLPFTEDMLEARKRLWYCVYVTDRWTCAVLGRPLAIADADCDIELPHIKGGSHGNKDYSIFIHFIKLSSILGEILRRIYSPKAKSQGYKSTSFYYTVQNIQSMLNNWLQQEIPDHHRFTSKEVETLYNNKIMSNKIREAGPLMITYYAVTILLYRVFLVVDKKDVLPVLLDEANKRCIESAKMIIDIARLLSSDDIIRFGWNLSLYSITQACLIHIYNCTSNSSEVVNLSREYVKICIKECLEPMTAGVANAPQYFVPLIQVLMQLIGANDTINDNPVMNNNIPNYTMTSTKSPSSTTNLLPDNYTQHYTSPMSVHAIICDDTTQQQQSSNSQQVEEGRFPIMEQSNNMPAPTSTVWQTLFSSAATPFFHNDSDWQNVLPFLFDDNTTKQTNTFM